MNEDEFRQAYESGIVRHRVARLTLAAWFAAWYKERCRSTSTWDGCVEVAGYELDVDSVIEKANTRGLRFDHVFDQMKDLSRMRIVARHPGQLHEIYQSFQKRSDSKILDEEGHTMNPRNTGYRALHFVIEVDFPYGGTTQSGYCEVQLCSSYADAVHKKMHDLYRQGRLTDDLSTRARRHSLKMMRLDEEAEVLFDQ